MRALAVLAVICCAQAQPDTRVSFIATKASVQNIVKTMAEQAGLGYNRQKSFEQTDPQCRRFVTDVMMAVPFETAMHRILDPVRLRYEVENGKVVLYWAKISYFSSRKSLQYIVLDLAKQVGLGYNFDQSLKQTDPQCRLFLNHVSVENQPFDKAMASILDPRGLRYRVESGKVVLYRR